MAACKGAPQHCNLQVGDIIEHRGSRSGCKGAWIQSEVLDISYGEAAEAIYLHVRCLNFDDDLRTVRLYEAVPSQSAKKSKKVPMARPQPPPHYTTFAELSSFQGQELLFHRTRDYVAGDAVDVPLNNCWWEGRVKKIDGDQATVGFPKHGAGEESTQTVSTGVLRPTLVWQDDTWRAPPLNKGVPPLGIFQDTTAADLPETPTIQAHPLVSEPLKKVDPFLDFTDDDVRQGLETLLGYVPRRSHPGVQQLGLRGFFKQKVKEMHAEELFSAAPVRAPAAKSARVHARSPARVTQGKDEKNALSTDLPRLQVTPEKKARLRAPAHSGDGAKTKTRAEEKSSEEPLKAELVSRSAEEALSPATGSGKTAVVENSGVEGGEKGPVSDIANGQPLSGEHKTIWERIADAEPREFLRGLLGRWDEVSPPTAVRAFEKLNGWTPEERSMLRNSGSVKAWCRAKFEEMLKRSGFYVRFMRKNSSRHAYRWDPWEEGQVLDGDLEANDEGEKMMEEAPVQKREGESNVEEPSRSVEVRKRKAEEGGDDTGAPKRVCGAGKGRSPGESRVPEEGLINVPGKTLREHRFDRDGRVEKDREKRGSGETDAASQKLGQPSQLSLSEWLVELVTGGEGDERAADTAEKRKSGPVVDSAEAAVPEGSASKTEEANGNLASRPASCLERSEAISSARALLDTWTPDALDEARGLFYMVNGWLPDEDELGPVQISGWFRQKLERLVKFAERCFQAEGGDGVGFVKWAVDEASVAVEHPSREIGQEGSEGPMLLSNGESSKGADRNAFEPVEELIQELEPVGELDRELLGLPQKVLRQREGCEIPQLENFPLTESDDFSGLVHTTQTEGGDAGVNAGNRPGVDNGWEVAAGNAETRAELGESGNPTLDDVSVRESAGPSGPIRTNEAVAGDASVTAGSCPGVFNGGEVVAGNAETRGRNQKQRNRSAPSRPRSTVGRLLRDVCALANVPRERKAAALRVVQYRRGMRAVGLDAHGALALLDAVECAAGAHFARDAATGRFGIARRPDGREMRTMPSGWYDEVAGTNRLKDTDWGTELLTRSAVKGDPDRTPAAKVPGGWSGAALTAREKVKMHGFILRLTGNMLQVLAHMSSVAEWPVSLGPDVAGPCAATPATVPTTAVAANSPQRSRVAPSSGYGARPSAKTPAGPRGGAQFVRDILCARAASQTAPKASTVGKEPEEVAPDPNGAASKEAPGRRDQTADILEQMGIGWGEALDTFTGLTARDREKGAQRSAATLLQNVCALANATREQKIAALRELHYAAGESGETSLGGKVAGDLALLEAVERAAAPYLMKCEKTGRVMVGRSSGRERRNMPHGWLASVVGQGGRAETGQAEGDAHEGAPLIGLGDPGAKDVPKAMTQDNTFGRNKATQISELVKKVVQILRQDQ
ncbi:hypothetical protein KFL_002460120 [Klebsormidium nitens]|uniref:Agenet domain-containing protein n=1 Tax=Klebsormidium nitens TaxID=105231 RepID=A0A1Y1IAB6_KLENI|nr:hypothetical protein KFL_002460120 [Klebsormidium nitens]|eukprot:GAQ85636.1 hypothetical protein KFL_002460120 [Klebsormidium nitens]